MHQHGHGRCSTTLLYCQPMLLQPNVAVWKWASYDCNYGAWMVAPGMMSSKCTSFLLDLCKLCMHSLLANSSMSALVDMYHRCQSSLAPKRHYKSVCLRRYFERFRSIQAGVFKIPAAHLKAQQNFIVQSYKRQCVAGRELITSRMCVVHWFLT